MPYTSVSTYAKLYQEISYLMLLQEIMKINYQQKS
ncbi:Uncharacterised protein [Salmonella enterica subsp. enterica]|nr:Uncharacterised protein [Salmonella enterica subsp. enterica]